jgi:hypothetical protein
MNSDAALGEGGSRSRGRRILGHNAGVAEHLHGGFVTCAKARKVKSLGGKINLKLPLLN